MTNPTIDKLDEILDSLWISNKTYPIFADRKIKAEQQILAWALEAVDKCDPQTGKETSKEYWGNKLRAKLTGGKE